MEFNNLKNGTEKVITLNTGLYSISNIVSNAPNNYYVALFISQNSNPVLENLGIGNSSQSLPDKLETKTPILLDNIPEIGIKPNSKKEEKKITPLIIFPGEHQIPNDFKSEIKPTYETLSEDIQTRSPIIIREIPNIEKIITQGSIIGLPYHLQRYQHYHSSTFENLENRFGINRMSLTQAANRPNYQGHFNNSTYRRNYLN